MMIYPESFEIVEPWHEHQTFGREHEGMYCEGAVIEGAVIVIMVDVHVVRLAGGDGHALVEG